MGCGASHAAPPKETASAANAYTVQAKEVVSHNTTENYDDDDFEEDEDALAATGMGAGTGAGKQEWRQELMHALPVGNLRMAAGPHKQDAVHDALHVRPLEEGVAWMEPGQILIKLLSQGRGCEEFVEWRVLAGGERVRNIKIDVGCRVSN